MENHQPKAQKKLSNGQETDSLSAKQGTGEEFQAQFSDSQLYHAVTNQIPPFVVTKNYKIRREQSCPEPESEPECINIQEKILNYSRKDKSLMELTRKFIQKFQGASSSILVLDKVTEELKVERRRIYDIINIMESLAVVAKRRKNVYEWRGLRKAIQTINGLSKQSQTPTCCRCCFSENDKNKKEKSLESLATEFLKLFSQNREFLTLQESAQLILTDANENAKKTKIRRLYDIINVFKCLGLVEKAKNPREVGGKPTYQWMGCGKLLRIIEEKQNERQNSGHLEEEFPLGSEQSLISSSSSQEENNRKSKSNSRQKKTFKKMFNPSVLKSISLRQDFKEGDEPFKDISNMGQSEGNCKRSRRNSESLSKEISVPLKKQASFSTAKLSLTTPCQDLQNSDPNPNDQILTPAPGTLHTGFALSSTSQSFFSSLMQRHSLANGSIDSIHSFLLESIWPS